MPGALLGIYRFRSDADGVTYLRFAFTGTITAHDPSRALDEGIIRAAWMTPEEIRLTADRHRSPLVMRCIDDYLAGQRYPLELLREQAA